MAARAGGEERREARLGWLLCAPALLTIAAVALFPLLFTLFESLHLHDLRMPWRGRPFVGLENYAEALGDGRFRGALGHTLFFAAASVTLELGLGLALALALHRGFRGRGLARTTALLPWALPTVVAALVWRFLFEDTGALTDPHAAWLPVVLADVWKTTPFVALLLLAGLQGIDPDLYEAARVDGATGWQQLLHVTLPLLRPALAVALVFRSLDALRVFDLIYVLTNGGPGTATEPLALYAFAALLQDLRFGYGSAVSMILFALSFALALVYVRLAGAALLERGR
jgi:ABC-type sugar transport system permease subunit